MGGMAALGFTTNIEFGVVLLSSYDGFFEYLKLVRIRAHLDSPREIIFEGLWQQAGQAGAAFMKSGDSYRKYQLCRDQWEFDAWEHKHGELKRINY
jgi:hypothetical protein